MTDQRERLMTAPLRLLRKQADQAYDTGDAASAARLQAEIVARLGAAVGKDELVRLSFFRFGAGDYPGAVATLREVLSRWPDDSESMVNMGVLLTRLHDYAAARAELERALPYRPDNTNLMDALAHACARLGDTKASRDYGERSLRLKDEALAGLPGLGSLPAPPPFRPDPARNAIAFSLWGKGPRYLEGALANARLMPHVYPGWHCRIYHDDSVPETVLAELARCGAVLIPRPRPRRLHEGLFWRFEVAFDSTLDRFLVRDIDSLIGVRERLAVDEWLASGRHFHLMRDFETHTDLILAGMWGGVAGILPDLSEARDHILAEPTRTQTVDQRFLGRHVWPLIRANVLIHDSRFSIFGARDFPANATIPAGWHVGQNAEVHHPATNPARWVGLDDLLRQPAAKVPATPRSRTVSLICAHPNANAGMMSVDAAFLSFLRRHGIACTFQPFSLLGEVPPLPSLPFAYNSLAKGFDKALQADLIVYWGDFMHAAPYQGELARAMTSLGIAPDLETGIDLAEKWLFLRDADDSVLERAIAFGGTIYSNYPDHFRSERYSRLLDRLYGRAHFVRMRDMLSAAWIDERFPRHAPSFGVDCALLLESRTMWPNRERPAPAPVLGYSINRTRDAEPLTRFALTLAERLGLSAQRLPWLSREDMTVPLDEKIARVAGCRLVVTDTYHLAITAWREGVPALSLGRAASPGNGSAEDKKKELFHLAHQARPFYIYTEALDQHLGPAGMDNIARLLADPRRAAFVTDGLVKRTRAVEADLASSIKTGLGLA